MNAATSPGDIVSLAAGTYAPFTVTASGTAADPISIVGPDKPFGTNTVHVTSPSNTPVVTVKDASYVTVQGIYVTQRYAASGLEISGSSNVTLTGSTVQQTDRSANPTVAIGSGSAYVTISKDEIESQSTAGSIVDQGDAHDVITTDVVPMDDFGPGLVLNQTPRIRTSRATM